ncbi:MAG: ComEC/Rec2 family competence protein [Chlamydiae bacterium]|nr:ComEC/Rec2 family competence protein [Chlamydiota bacterium]
MQSIVNGASGLWKKSPALLLGLQLLLGIAFSFSNDFFLLLIAIIITLPFWALAKEKMYAQTLLCLSTCIFGALYGHIIIDKEPSLNFPEKGYALFSPSNIKQEASAFHSSFVYKGELTYFVSESTEAYDIPCRVKAPKGERPKANSSFFLSGSLKKNGPQSFEFITDGPWQKVKNTYSFAQMRYNAKKAFHTFVKKQISDKKASDFLYALCTGEVEDRMMSHEFSKLGLQHILAVSGFHFALIALFAGSILKRLFPEKIYLFLLILLISFYFFFLGSSPSVFRAWIAITLWSLGKILEKKSRGLNTLGVCLLIELIISPRCIFHLGFQLSFLCTAALLLCTPVTLQWMKVLFPPRDKSVLLELSPLERVAYLFCCFFRGALAITLAVHIASIPVCLYHFGTFPLLSLTYNIFFPWLTGISMFGFMTASLFSFCLPFLANLLNSVNTSFTSFLMELSAHPPSLLQYNISVSVIPASVVILYLTVLLFFFSALSAEKSA